MAIKMNATEEQVIEVFGQEVIDEMFEGLEEHLSKDEFVKAIVDGINKVEITHYKGGKIWVRKETMVLRK